MTTATVLKQTCPVCSGTGSLSRDPSIPGDIVSWGSVGTSVYTCNVCSGAGVIGYGNTVEPPNRLAPVVDPDALVPTQAMAAVRRVFEHGHKTYAAYDNGDKPDTRDRVYHLRKAESHMGEYRSGERSDEDTGESPLAHVISRLMLALEHDLRGRS